MSGLSRQRRRLNTVIALCLLVVAPFLLVAYRFYSHWREERADPLDEAGEREVRQALERLATERDACNREWRAQSSRESLARIHLRPNAAACPVRLYTPTGRAATSYVQYGSIDQNYFASWSLTLVRPGEPVGDRGAACVILDWKIDNARKQLERGEADSKTLAWARTTLAQPRGSGYSALVLIAEETKGVVLQDRFLGGRVRGRAFVYSDARRRFVCAGDVEAWGSPSVDLRFTYMKRNSLDHDSKAAAAGDASLARDLEVQLRRAIAAQVVAIDEAPPP